MSESLEISPFITAEEMARIIKERAPGNWPTWTADRDTHWCREGQEMPWETWPNVNHAHKLLFDEFLQDLVNWKPKQLEEWEGLGIVIAAGGPRYFPSLYVHCRVLREILHVDLPIEVWYLGEREMDPYMKRIIRDIGGTFYFIDGFQVAKDIPVRILAGWELKPYATLYSRFAEVLFLDADSCPVFPLERLFHHPACKVLGAVFFPDYPWWVVHPYVWNFWGMPDLANNYQNEVPFESGQYFINKVKFYQPLRLALWFCEHSDFVFKMIYGDKETFHLAWRKLGSPYEIPPYSPSWILHTIIQHDFSGRPFIQHRVRDKWNVAGVGNTKVSELLYEEQMFEYAMQLARKWTGTIWMENFDLTREEREMAEFVTAKRWSYNRVGYGSRPMRFLTHWKIGEGAAGCEQYWCIFHDDDADTYYLTISYCKPDGSRHVICRCKWENTKWVGEWLDFEKMPIEIVPVDSRNEL